MSDCLVGLGALSFAFIMYQAVTLGIKADMLVNGLISMLLLTVMYGAVVFVALIVGRYIANLISLSFFRNHIPSGHVISALDKRDWQVFVLLYFVSIINWYIQGKISETAWAVYYAFLGYHFFKGLNVFKPLKARL